MLTDFKTVHLRQHDIQKHQIILALLRISKRFFSVIRTVYFHVILLQTETDPFYD